MVRLHVDDSLPSAVRSTVYDAEDLGVDAPAVLPRWTCPPVNGQAQTRTMTGTRRHRAGTRVGAGPRTPTTMEGPAMSYDDAYDDYGRFSNHVCVRCTACSTTRAPSTSTSTTARPTTPSCMLDEIFGRRMLPERDHLGLRLRRPRQAPLARQARHDPGLRQGPGAYHFDSAEVDREPYMAPGLVAPEKAARGKLPTDVWWHTIVSPTGAREDRLSDAEARGHPARGWWPPRAGRATGAWTSSPAAARSAPSLRARAPLRPDRLNPEAVAVMRARLPDGTRLVRAVSRPGRAVV